MYILTRPKNPFGLHETVIKNTSSALELMKVWRQEEIPTQTHPIAGVELRRSPIQVPI